MIAKTPARRPRTGVPDVELLSLGWRRIQVLLRVRPAGDRASIRQSLRLRHKASGAAVPVTGWEAERRRR